MDRDNATLKQLRKANKQIRRVIKKKSVDAKSILETLSDDEIEQLDAITEKLINRCKEIKVSGERKQIRGCGRYGTKKCKHNGQCYKCSRCPKSLKKL